MLIHFAAIQNGVRCQPETSLQITGGNQKYVGGLCTEPMTAYKILSGHPFGTNYSPHHSTKKLIPGLTLISETITQISFDTQKHFQRAHLGVELIGNSKLMLQHIKM